MESTTGQRNDFLLKTISIDVLSNGKRVTIPQSVSEANREQQIKRFIEIADTSTFDGQLHLSLFRRFHGGEWTLRIIQDVLVELRQPSIQLDISQARSDVLPFFEYQFERHKGLRDEDFGYPGALSTPNLIMQ